MHYPSLNQLLFSGLLLVLPSLVFSLPEDRDKPIHLEADRAQLDQKTGTSVYEGNVVITQGSMRLAADTATIYTENGSFQRMEAVGKPATLRYKPAVDKAELHGSSQRVEYDASQQTIVLITNAKVTQGSDEFTGDRIEYNLEKDLVKARGSAEQRIQITIQPKTKQ
jgi:lipopolysaccharide export system protein LptA